MAHYDNTGTLPSGGSVNDYSSTADVNLSARLRKINLNVDIATQAELISVYNELSDMIQQSGTDWKAADVQLSNDIKAWALGNELSGALHSEITAETYRADTVEEAIRNDLSTNYVVTVEAQSTAESGYAATYIVKQGGNQVGDKINIPKDFLVKSAELCTVTIAGEPYAEAQVGDKYIDFVINSQDGAEQASHIYLPINDLVDTYTGGSTDFATVIVDPTTNIITTNVSADVISAAAVNTVVGSNNDASTANTVWGAKAYADQLVNGINASGDTLVNASVSNGEITVSATNDLTAAVDAANSALQSITASGSGFVSASASTKANNTQEVTVSLTTADLSTATTADGLVTALDAKNYIDTAVGEVVSNALTGVNVNGTPLTVASNTVNVTVVEGATNGTIAVNGTDVVVHGLDTAAYEAKEAFDKAGDAAALQTAVKATVNDTRFDVNAIDDYADIDAIIADLVKVRQALGALKDLNITLTPAV